MGMCVTALSLFYGFICVACFSQLTRLSLFLQKITLVDSWSRFCTRLDAKPAVFEHYIELKTLSLFFPVAQFMKAYVDMAEGMAHVLAVGHKFL